MAPPIYVPTTSFKLMVLRNVRVEKALLSKGASVTIINLDNEPALVSGKMTWEESLL